MHTHTISQLFANSDAHDSHNSQAHARQHCKDCNHVFESNSTLEAHRGLCSAATSSSSLSAGPSLIVEECSDPCLPVLRKEDNDEDDDDEDDEDDYGHDDLPDEHGVFPKMTKLEIPGAVVADAGDTVRRVKPRHSWLSLLPLSPASLSSLSLSSATSQRTPITPTTPSSPLARTVSAAPPETTTKKGRIGLKFVATLRSRVRSIASLH